MADDCPPNSIPLKVMIDKKNQRVAFAEADATFTDTLVSFLTLPLGTVVKLLSSHANSPSLGSTKNLYQSVQSLQPEMFQTDICKTMLLHPKNAAGNTYRCLKFKVDSSEWDLQETRYLCPSECSFGLYEGMKCICDQEMTIKDLSFSFTQSSAFINESVVLLIANDMRLMQISTTTVKSALQAQGLLDQCNALEEKKVYVEVPQLLLSVLFSGTPLTDVVFPRKTNTLSLLLDTCLKNPKTESQETEENDVKKIHVKLVFRNSDKRILYAEVGSDFLDLIFSFLTIPTGAIVKLLGKNSPLKSLNSLSSSIRDSKIVNLLKNNCLKKLLVCPKLAPSFKCDNQLLGLTEEIYNLPPFSKRWNCRVDLRNPKFHNLSGKCGNNYLKGSEMFIVTDDLVVRPLSSNSIVSYLDGLKIPFSDVEEKDVSAGKCEALRLLKATLESTTVLTDAFGPFLGSSGK